jgi:hypothetical protein
MENNIVKILIIDSAKTPIHTEKYEFDAGEGDKIKNTILDSLNRLGKATHALIKYKNDFWVADHTAQGKISSTTYYRHKIKYHPFMKELS